MLKTTDIVVVIPLYKENLTVWEEKSLSQCLSVLKRYPIVLVTPQTLNTRFFEEKYPIDSIERFDDSFFKDITGYNTLLLSTQFYERFLKYKYLLIYQLDAYVFQDLLMQWAEKGYDYIGAPWLKKPVYNFPIISHFMRFQHKYRLNHHQSSKQSLYNKVGNGGFSLRKIESHYQATIDSKNQIENYLAQKRTHFYNEDVFWATEIPDFSYPEPLEALTFSFDKYPDYCFKLNNHELPFGCHGWYKRKMKKFWKPVIGF
ncbi:hypothetical protein AGMMS50262_18080 [Bacteroidia bacterium]|nr:hypothetical protein AGMMS50262_18080 [Bacteroidia bacterium]